MTAEKTAAKAAKKTTHNSAPKKAGNRASAAATKKTNANTRKRSLVRKAPTTVATSRPRRRLGWPLYAMLLVLLSGIGASVFLGLSDPGPINIDGVVQEKKRSATPEEKAELDRVGERRSNPQQAVDGGLVPSTDQRSKAEPDTSPAPTATASSSASSTEAEQATAASSTEGETVTEESGSDSDNTDDAELTPSEQ